ncbi:MAG: hypothetical protein COA96_07835 [SAR86 cluster bacterium]|uniref:Uncharacterized protein n=1 Tax=SAR86 cluster bacterium TaxID=2030880 RepID=A0A2A5B109_9GAMM|nr:MAG: hypothetical protein COA96_07835 [SAR86 cluster bacterium]
MNEESIAVKTKLATSFVIGMCALALLIAIHHTFFDQDLVASMVGISSAFTMYFLYRNPEILMAKSWDEFGELYDNSRDKKYLWGFPLYQLLMLSAALYIWLV